MSERPQRYPFDRAEQVRREAEDALRFFIVSGMRTYVAANHSEGPLRFLIVT